MFKKTWNKMMWHNDSPSSFVGENAKNCFYFLNCILKTLFIFVMEAHICFRFLFLIFGYFWNPQKAEKSGILKQILTKTCYHKYEFMNFCSEGFPFISWESGTMLHPFNNMHIMQPRFTHLQFQKCNIWTNNLYRHTDIQL